MQRRIIALGLVAGCTGYTYPPPPADSVASCHIDYIDGNGAVSPRGTTYANSLGQVIRADGYLADPGSLTMTYDDQGRLSSETDSKNDVAQYTYSTDQILSSGPNPEDNWVYLLENGLVTAEGPTAAQATTDYTYDSSGRLLTHTGGNVTYVYTYDAQGRVATAISSYTGQAVPFTYTETADQLTIGIDLGDTGIDAFVDTWVFNFDGSHRLIRAADEWNGFNYTYDDVASTITETPDPNGGSFSLRAVGACPALSTSVPMPPLPLPLTWGDGGLSSTLSEMFDGVAF